MTVLRHVVAGVACIMGGCSSLRSPELKPGAERVSIVSSDAAVAGATFISSCNGTLGTLRIEELPVRAKNFGATSGADMVLVRQSTAGPTVSYTFEAWNR